MIYVVATIQLTAGKRDEFLEHQQRLLPLVRAEQGCRLYDPSVDVFVAGRSHQPPRDNVVVMHEQWDSIEALEAHLIAPHMLAFRETVRQLVVGVNIEVFQAV